MNDFGDRLIQLRADSKLTLNEICRGAAIPPSRLVELERGIRIPTAGQIEHLENFYNITGGELTELARVFEKAD